VDLPTDTVHPLGAVLADAARGVFPRGELPVRVVPPPPHLVAAVIAFSGCTYLAADVDPDEVVMRLGSNPLVGPVLPKFLEWLAGEVGGQALNNEIVLAAIGTGEIPSTVTPQPSWRNHARAQHGARFRRDVSGWSLNGDEGIVLVGRGLVDRWEVAYEAATDAPPHTGRALAAAALGLVPAGEAVFAQIAPGHAQSLRTALAAGYRPVGGEVLFVRDT
jgi:hypothetical protein